MNSVDDDEGPGLPRRPLGVFGLVWSVGWIAVTTAVLAGGAAPWAVSVYLIGALLELGHDLVFGLSPVHSWSTMAFSGMKWIGVIAMVVT